MSFVQDLNSAMDRVEGRRFGHRSLRLLAMGATALGGAIVTFTAGSTQASAVCEVCCTQYGGYNCNTDCGRISSTTWSCTNSCGFVCTCPDCWLPSGQFVNHCDNGCGSGPHSPTP